MMRFPRWLSWIVLIGLGWILFVGNTRERTPLPPKPTHQETGAPQQPRQYKELETLLDGERWKKALNPDYESPEEACRTPKRTHGQLEGYAIIRTSGSGSGAACGDTVELSITRYGNDGKANKPMDVTLTLGEQPALDALLLDLRAGEDRLLIVSLPERVKVLPVPPNTQLLLGVHRAAMKAEASPSN